MTTDKPKKISDIGSGNDEYFRRLDPPFDTEILSVCDLRPGEKHYENVFVYNEKEREQLLFLAWHTAWRKAIRAFEDYEYKEGGHPGDGDSEFYAWIKEQGP